MSEHAFAEGTSVATYRPGAQLAEARAQRGWSIEQVADQLKLAPRQVVALENDNYAALPGIAVTRGFMRAYAKLVGVDPAPLLQTMAPALPNQPSQAIPAERNVVPPFVDGRKTVLTEAPGRWKWWGLGTGFVLFAGLFTAQEMRWFPVDFEPLSARIERYAAARGGAKSPVASAETIATSTPAAIPAPAVGSEPPPATGPEGAITSAAIPVQAQAQAQPAITPAPAAPATLPAPTPESTTPNVLIFHAKEDSWVEVRRPDKTSAFSHLMHAGESTTIEVRDGLSLTVGNARGVEAILRGAPLPLETTGKGNVARMTVK